VGDSSQYHVELRVKISEGMMGRLLRVCSYTATKKPVIVRRAIDSYLTTLEESFKKVE